MCSSVPTWTLQSRCFQLQVTETQSEITEANKGVCLPSGLTCPTFSDAFLFLVLLLVLVDFFPCRLSPSVRKFTLRSNVCFQTAPRKLSGKKLIGQPWATCPRSHREGSSPVKPHGVDSWGRARQCTNSPHLPRSPEKTAGNKHLGAVTLCQVHAEYYPAL